MPDSLEIPEGVEMPRGFKAAGNSAEVPMPDGIRLPEHPGARMQRHKDDPALAEDPNANELVAVMMSKHQAEGDDSLVFIEGVGYVSKDLVDDE